MTGGAELGFRRLGRSDFPLLSAWLAAPHVERWWREDPSLDALEARYGGAVDGTEPAEHFVVERDGVEIGMVQRYLLEDEPAWRSSLAPTGCPLDAAGIDYLIGSESLIGRGLGAPLIAGFVEQTWQRYLDISAVVVNVAQDNRRSWRVLEKVGFHRAWSGELDSEDPSDAGLNYVYVLYRP